MRSSKARALVFSAALALLGAFAPERAAAQLQPIVYCTEPITGYCIEFTGYIRYWDPITSSYSQQYVSGYMTFGQNEFAYYDALAMLNSGYAGTWLIGVYGYIEGVVSGFYFPGAWGPPCPECEGS